MDRTYILHRIYTSENSAEHRDTQLSEMYPDVAGTKESESERRLLLQSILCSMVSRELARIQSF